MIKTILVPVSGTPSDEAVFRTAMILAERAKAHLAFHHARVTATEAALHAPHMAFCVGAGLPAAMDLLGRQVESLSSRALAHVEAFCFDYGVALGGRPIGEDELTASWSEAPDQDAEDLLIRARHADLTVLGRPRHTDYMPFDLIETLLVKSGRPIVLAPDIVPPPPSIETVMIGWKETPEAARALTAAMPILRRAKQVLVAHVAEGGEKGRPLMDLVYHLARHGIAAERKEIDRPGAATATLLMATAVELSVDLLVLGGYSRRPLTERIFGGVTQSVIESAPLPVFLLH